MTTKECSSLMMWCGALHDIAEKTDRFTAMQIKEVEKKIENLVMNSGVMNSGEIYNSIKVKHEISDLR